MFETSLESVPSEAPGFSMKAQQDKFLGGMAQEKAKPKNSVFEEIRETNRRIQQEVFSNNKPLHEAYLRYTNPYTKGLSAEQMRESLGEYVSLAGQDEAYQKLMADLRSELPEEVSIYRGQIGEDGPRELENYSVDRNHAEVFAMGEEGFKENAVIVERKIRRDQIVALGSRREAEVIVKAETSGAQQPTSKAA